MSDLHKLLENRGAIVLFDTETTGTDYKNCRIIELAALRVERNTYGEICITERYDNFVKLPEGQTIPKKITEITGITDDILSDGISEEQAVNDFQHLIRADNYKFPTLIISYNAQFDMLFLTETFARHGCDDLLLEADVLDALTVYKDRRPYPHKLSDAISEYGLDDKVQNTHRAIDDVFALYEVCKALDDERSDLSRYINLFGFNPKYGISGEKIPGIFYEAQPYVDDIQPEERSLPIRHLAQGLIKINQDMERFTEQAKDDEIHPIFKGIHPTSEPKAPPKRHR